MPPSPTVDLSFLRTRVVQKQIAAVTVAFTLAGVGYALLAPKWYTASITVVPVGQQKGGGLSSLLGAGLGSLAGGFEAALGGAEPARIAAVLESNAVSDAVIAKFELRDRYGEKRIEEVRKELWRHCSVRVLTKPNLVQLACEDKDPRFVTDMVAYFADFGNQTFRRVNTGSASEEVRFLEARVGELRKETEASSERMREFQEKHRIVDLDTQAKAVVSALAGLNAQRISKQLELDYARTFAAGDEASIRQLQSQLSVVSGRMRSLEQPAPAASLSPTGEAGGGTAASLFPPAMVVPELRAEYEKLYRDRKVSEASLVFALERLESARAAEARSVSTFQVLDPPTVPEKQSRPKRSLVVLAATLIGLLGSLTGVWLRNGGADTLRDVLGIGAGRGSEPARKNDGKSP